MTATELFLKQATRGLWGHKKRDVMTELRGAIEDKIYRHRLSGLSESEAERAALRELGSPLAIAHEMTTLHTAPTLLRITLLLGITGLLGIRAAAQLPMVHAAPIPVEVTCTYTDERLAQFAPKDRANVRERIRQAGGRANYEAACRAKQRDAGSNDLLKLSDLIAALRAAHVEVRSLPGLEAYLQLRLPGGDWQSLNLADSVISIQAGGTTTREPYVYAIGLLQQLLYSFKGPLALTGTVNPTLHIGPAQMQLGTAQHPVLATNLYSTVVLDAVTDRMTRTLPGSVRTPDLVLMPDEGEHLNHTQLGVTAKEGSVYALVGAVDGQVGMTVRAVRDGRLELPCDCRNQPFVQTDDLKTLLDWAQQGTVGLLVYAVDVSDLRHLTLTPVPTTQLTLVQP